jgi:hypothetical protein
MRINLSKSKRTGKWIVSRGHREFFAGKFFSVGRGIAVLKWG